MNPDASSGEAKDIGIHGMNAGIWKESRESGVGVGDEHKCAQASCLPLQCDFPVARLGDFMKGMNSISFHGV